MWNPKGERLAAPPWQRFSLERVLLDYDGPRLVLRRTLSGQLYLVWWVDTDGFNDRWIYLTVSLARLHAILSGGVRSLDALREPEDGYVLIVDENIDTGELSNIVYVTDTDAIPSEVLPLAEARLNVRIPDDIVSIPAQDRAHMIDVYLEPTSEDVGRVASRVASQFIGNLQRLVDALGQAAKGNPTSRGNIPVDILQETRLDVISTYPGSLGVRLETHAQDDVLGESLGRTAIGFLFELIEAGSDVGKLSAQLQVHRGRVAKSYEDLLGTIESSLPSASLRWAQGWQPNYRQVSITNQRAREIRIQVQEVERSIRETSTIIGTLVAGSLRTWRFEIEDEAGNRAAGRISEEAASQMRALSLGSACRAVLLPEILVSTTTGEEQISYTLIDIGPVGTENGHDSE